jgi:hypothetical protein
MKIEPLEKNPAAESVRPIYEQLEKKTWRVINMFEVMAHKPNALGPFRELAYLQTSLMNGCEY